MFNGHRNPRHGSSSLQRSDGSRFWKGNLVLFAVVSGALLGAPIVAQASTIYRFWGPLSVTGSTSEGPAIEEKVDVDGNGTADATFLASESDTGASVKMEAEGYAYWAWDNEVQTRFGTSTGSIALAMSSPGSAQPTGFAPYVLLADSRATDGTPGNWVDGLPHWLAVQFALSGGAMTTGWVDISIYFAQDAPLGGSRAHFTIYGTAYDHPDDPAPEPGSMAVFAAGAVGILAWRRREAARD